jgi:hypothetical protein
MRWLCDECWRSWVDGAAWCEACVARIRSARDPLPAAFATTFVLVGLAISLLASRSRRIHPAAAAVAVVVVGIVLAIRHARWPPGVLAPRVLPRERGGGDSQVRPVRDAARRAVRRLVAPVSGRATVILLVIAFAASATLVPWALDLSPWLEVEAALAGCWLALWATLATLLYRGTRVVDDYYYQAPTWPWGRRKPAEPEERTGSPFDGCWAPGGCGSSAEGCLVVFTAALVVAVTFVVALAMFELVFPLLFLLVYTVIRSALASVANDDHGCEGA